MPPIRSSSFSPVGRISSISPLPRKTGTESFRDGSAPSSSRTRRTRPPPFASFGDPYPRIRAYAVLVESLVDSGQPQAAAHAAQYTLLERAMFDDDLDAKSRAYTTRADVLYKLGDGAAKSAFRQAEEASQHTKGNDTTRRLETLLYLNQVLSCAREIEAARRIADQVLATARKADNATTHQYFFLAQPCNWPSSVTRIRPSTPRRQRKPRRSPRKATSRSRSAAGCDKRRAGQSRWFPRWTPRKSPTAQILGHIVDLKASVKAENKAEAKQAAERALTTVRAHGDILFSYPIFPEFSKAIILSGEGSALRQFAQNVTDPMSQFRAHSQLAVALAEVGVLLAKVGKVQEASKKVQGASDEARSAQEAADRMGDRKLRLKNLAEWARDLAPNMPLSAETVARKVLAEVDPASDDSEVRANSLAALVETSVRNQKPETARRLRRQDPARHENVPGHQIPSVRPCGAGDGAAVEVRHGS